jgi:hypothetical protein
MELSEVNRSRLSDQACRHLKWRLMQFLGVVILTLFLFGLFCQWSGPGSNGWANVEGGKPYRLVFVTQIPWDSETDENPHTLTEQLNRLARESKIEKVRESQWWAISDTDSLQALTTTLNSDDEIQASIWNLGGNKVAEDLEAFCAGEFTAEVLCDEDGQVVRQSQSEVWSLVSGTVKPVSLALNGSDLPNHPLAQSQDALESLPGRTVYGVSELLTSRPSFQLSIPASLGLTTTVLIVAVTFGVFCRRFERTAAPDNNG